MVDTKQVNAGPSRVRLWARWLFGFLLLIAGCIAIVVTFIAAIAAYLALADEIGVSAEQAVLVAFPAAVTAVILLTFGIKLMNRADGEFRQYHETLVSDGTVTSIYVTATATVKGTNGAGRAITCSVDVPADKAQSVKVGDKFPWGE